MIRKISTLFGATAIVLGMMMMAGSAGDCDGACMEMANSLSEMLMIAGAGLAVFMTGIFFMMVGHDE